MNYQKKCDELEAAALELGLSPDMLDYYAWPQVFGSTSGPFTGIGGQAISTFTIEAYSDGRNAVLFCNGRRIKQTSNFEPMMRI